VELVEDDPCGRKPCFVDASDDSTLSFEREAGSIDRVLQHLAHLGRSGDSSTMILRVVVDDARLLRIAATAYTSAAASSSQRVR
jgi:hypothetical protein